MKTTSNIYSPYIPSPVQDLVISYSDLYKSWMVNLGAMHGLNSLKNKADLILGVFEDNGSTINFPNNTHFATITKVFSTMSKIEMHGYETPDKAKNHKAKIMTWPLGCIHIYFEQLNPEDIELVLLTDTIRDEVIDQYKHTTSFAFVQIASNRADADYWVNLYKEGEQIYYRIIHQDTLQVIHQQEFVIPNVLQTLNKIARWTNALRLDNPFAKMEANKVDLILEDLQGNTLAKNGKANFTLEMEEEYGDWIHPCNLKIINNSQQDIYCSLLYLSDKYEINNELLPTLFLKAGASYSLEEIGGLEVCILKDAFDKGIRTGKDIFKLLISDQPFKSRVLNQNDLEDGTSIYYRSMPAREHTFQHLLNTLHKGYVLEHDHETITGFSNWFTQQITIQSQIPI